MRGIPGAASTDSPSREKTVHLVDSQADSEYEDDIDGVPCKQIILNISKTVIDIFLFSQQR